MSHEHLLSARKVADLFGVCLKTLHNWEERELLIPERINHRRYFHPADVEALIEGQRGEPRRLAPISPADEADSRSE